MTDNTSILRSAAVRTPFFTARLCLRLMLLVLLTVSLAGCKTSRKAESHGAQSLCLSSKVRLTIPHKDATFTVSGTMKLKSGERMQLSFLMPILRTEVARMDITPDEVLLVDRMGKRYVRVTRGELRGMLPRKANFENLEKMLFKASRPGAKNWIDGKELGLKDLEKCRIELTEFSNKPINLTPTEVSSRYREVTLEELFEMLLDLSA